MCIFQRPIHERERDSQRPAAILLVVTGVLRQSTVYVYVIFGLLRSFHLVAEGFRGQRDMETYVIEVNDFKYGLQK